MSDTSDTSRTRKSLGALPSCFWIVVIPAFACLLFGIYSSQDGVMGLNPCKMTYTSRNKKIVVVESAIEGPKLYKFTNFNSKKLNQQPILFIPGHKGMVDQVRSFSSTSHNGDDFFQYFSIDFQEASSAFHGSDILTQAVFVNDALKNIQTMYRENGQSADKNTVYEVPKIIILAHSVGGMVARTSVLLSNHPTQISGKIQTDEDSKLSAVPEYEEADSIQCGVSDIIMLSSPNNRPPYSPDSSQDVLYNGVNRAWAGSLYSHSNQCLSSAIKQRASISSSSLSSSNNTATVTADWYCPPCAAKIRLTSISGGVLDSLVSPSLTRLDGLAPVPRNITKERTPPPSMLSVLSPVLYGPMYVLIAGVRGIGRVGSTYFFSKKSNVTDCSSSSSSSNTEKAEKAGSASTDASDIHIQSNGTCPSTSSPETSTLDISITETENEEVTESSKVASKSAKTGISGTVEETKKRELKKGSDSIRISESDWMHMTPYIEPRHLSIRTTQLLDVGFPIDHNAILWCFQFVSTVTKSMRELSLAEKDGNGDSIVLEDVFIKKDTDKNKSDIKKKKSTKKAKKGMKDAIDDRKESKEENKNSIDSDINIDVNNDINNHIDQIESSNSDKIDENENNTILKDITPVIGIARRAASKTYWKDANKTDREYLRKKSPLGMLQTMVYEYMTSHLSKIIIMYLLISVLILTVPLFRALSNNSNKNNNNNNNEDKNTKNLSSFTFLPFLQPWCHTHMEIISPALDSTIKSLLPLEFNIFITPDRPLSLYILIGLSIIMVPKMTFEYIFRPLDFLINYSFLIYWFISYGAALMLIGLLNVFISLVQWITTSSWYALRIVLRSTVWCQFIRRKYRYLFKSVKNIFVTKLGIPPVVFQTDFIGFCFLLGIVSTGFIIGGRRAWDRAFGINSFLTTGTFLMSLISITLAVGAIVLLLFMMLFPLTLGNDKDANQIRSHLQLEEQNMHRRHLSSLLIFFPAMIAPSILFSYTLLYLPEKKYLAALPLFDMFGPERLNFLVCLFAIISHLLLSRQIGYASREVKPIGWMVEMLGPADRGGLEEDYFSSSTSSYSSSSSSSSSSSRSNSGWDGGSRKSSHTHGVKGSQCMHEDGGRYAIFESTERNPNVTLSQIFPGVVLGPLFKVVSCACAKDKNLKDSSEWCEFCLCRRCGGKHLPAESSSRSTAMNRDGTVFADISSDLLLFFGLIAVCVGLVVNGSNDLYRHLYLMGCVCTFYTLRDLCYYFSSPSHRNHKS